MHEKRVYKDELDYGEIYVFPDNIPEKKPIVIQEKKLASIPEEKSAQTVEDLTAEKTEI